MDLATHRLAVHEVGYTVVRGALTADEVGRLRFGLLRYLDEPGKARHLQGGRVKRNPFAFEPGELLPVLGHRRLANVLLEIAGGPVRFAGEAGLGQNLASTWHKDMRGLASTTFDSGPDAPGIYKILLYLQDHVGLDAQDFALKVRRGSHLIADIDGGDEDVVFIRAGDAIVMDCRLTHRGQDRPAAGIAARAVERLIGVDRRYRFSQRLRRALGRDDRLLVTVLYGRPDHWTDAFMRNSRETEQHRVPGLPVDLPVPMAWQEALRSVGIGT